MPAIPYQQSSFDPFHNMISFISVSKLGEATMALGREVAPHIRKQGEKYMPASWTKKDSSGERSRIDDVAEVAVGGLKGLLIIF